MIQTANKHVLTAFLVILLGVMLRLEVAATSIVKDSLVEMHKLEYKKCKGLFKLAKVKLSNLSLPCTSQPNIFFFKKKPYESFTYRNVNSTDTLVIVQRIIELRKLSETYRQIILINQKENKQKLLADSKTLTPKEYNRIIREINAFEKSRSLLADVPTAISGGNAASIQKQLLQQIHQTGKLPPGMQARKSTLASMPLNNIPFDDLQAKAFALDSMAKAGSIGVDSLQKLKPDSLLFKPNPYAAMGFAKRIKPAFTWQTLMPQGSNPAMIELMPGISFLWRPKLTPTFHLIYRQGLGSGLDNLSLTYEGWGFQMGARSNLLGKGFLFTAWEARNLPGSGNNELSDKFLLNSTAIIGLGYSAMLDIMIVCDVRKLMSQRNYTAFNIRFNF